MRVASIAQLTMLINKEGGESPMFFRRYFERTRREKKYRDLLSVYPVFSPPFTGHKITEAQARENLKYLLQEKEGRTGALRRFLAEFGCDLDDMEQLSAWVMDDSGNVLTRERIVYQLVYYSYTPAWTGNLAGLNVLNDIAVFCGDSVIKRIPTAQWDIRRFRDPDSTLMSTYYKNRISGIDSEKYGKLTAKYLHDLILEFAEMSRHNISGKYVATMYLNKMFLRDILSSITVSQSNSASRK